MRPPLSISVDRVFCSGMVWLLLFCAVLPSTTFATFTAKSAKQYRADTGAEIPPGGTIPAGVGVCFDCLATDTTGATIQMQVELQKLPATWAGTPNRSSSYVASGSRPRTSATSGLAAGNYGWRFRVVNNAGQVGVWVAPGNPDFIVQAAATPATTSPVKPVVSVQTASVAVAATTPSISSVSPTSMPPLNGKQTMIISGNNFQTGATLTFMPPDGGPINSTAARLTFVSSSQINYQINNAGNSGAWTVRVNNPDGQQSRPLSFTVAAVAQSSPSPVATAPTTYIYNASPSSLPSGQPDFTSSYYTTDNHFWRQGDAPASTRPPNPPGCQLGNALGNCTWYAYGRMLQLGYDAGQLALIAPPGKGNAELWLGNARHNGILVDNNPAVGAIAQNVSKPHVAVVEAINGNMITVSESAYIGDNPNPNSSWHFLWRLRTVSSTSFENYIHVSNSSMRPTLSKASLPQSTIGKPPSYAVDTRIAGSTPMTNSSGLPAWLKVSEIPQALSSILADVSKTHNLPLKLETYTDTKFGGLIAGGEYRITPNASIDLKGVAGTLKVLQKVDDVATLYSIYDNAKSEFESRGITGHSLINAWVSSPQSIVFAFQNPDAGIKALVEGLTSASAVSIRFASFGLVEVHGPEVEQWVNKMANVNPGSQTLPGSTLPKAGSKQSIPKVVGVPVSPADDNPFEQPSTRSTGRPRPPVKSTPGYMDGVPTSK